MVERRWAVQQREYVDGVGAVVAERADFSEPVCIPNGTSAHIRFGLARRDGCWWPTAVRAPRVSTPGTQPGWRGRSRPVGTVSSDASRSRANLVSVGGNLVGSLLGRPAVHTAEQLGDRSGGGVAGESAGSGVVCEHVVERHRHLVAGGEHGFGRGLQPLAQVASPGTAERDSIVGMDVSYGLLRGRWASS